jgi:hypothetical protein
MKNKIKFLLMVLVLLTSIQISLKADGKLFTKQDIQNLSDAYIHNNLGLKNPAFVDVDKDGKFDILIFNDGNVEYYRNTGTLEKPFFVLENKHYDHYSTAAFFIVHFPYPIFFADASGNGKLDMFIVKGEEFNTATQKEEYNIVYEENQFIDTGLLITLILVLVIVILVVAIVR